MLTKSLAFPEAESSPLVTVARPRAATTTARDNRDILNFNLTNHLWKKSLVIKEKFRRWSLIN